MENVAAVDRLSTLPDDLIHHILSFISISDAFRMHVLSKQWRTMWIDIPMMYIEKKYEDYKFHCKLVQNCLNRRCRQSQQHEGTAITRFKLYLDYANDWRGIVTPQVIYGWLNSVSETNTTLKELDVCIKLIENGIDVYYQTPIIPESVLNNVGSSLTLLRLEAISLKPNCVISLPSLTSLSLIDPRFEDAETLVKLIYGCPSIQNLHLSGWYFILAKNKYYDDYTDSLCGIYLTSVCVSLTSLSLCKVEISDGWLENLIFGLPLLERLTLDSCDGLVDFKIRSKTLKSFFCAHKYFPDIESATLDTPNLVYFNYKGRANSTFSINSHNLLEANVSLSLCSSHYTEWYLNLILFLSCLNCSSSTTLRLYLSSKYFPSKDFLLVPQKIKKTYFSPLPDLKHLKVKICDAYTDDDFSIHSSESRAALLWWAPSSETLEIE